RSRIMADGLVGSSASSYSTILAVVEQAAITRKLIEIAAQLAAYRSQSGNYPENLTDVVPKVFAHQPVDSVHVTPIHYRRLSDTNILLYGVGPNGRDDGGSSGQRSVYRGLPSYQMEPARL